MAKGPKPRPFWEQVKTGEPGECWPWTGRHDKDGYGGVGRHMDGVRYQRAHRLAYRLHYGSDPGALLVLHTCDNPPCCNPTHLRLGTVEDNNADMLAKGRERYPTGDEHWSHRRPDRVARGERHYSYGGVPGRRGISHPLAKLTDEQVHEMRVRYTAGGITFKALGAEYGVTAQHAHAVVRRRFRSYVE